MRKLWGCALIAVSAALLFAQLCRAQRQRLAAAAECRAALEQTASLIRALRQPLPELLRRQSTRPCCGALFAQIGRALAQGQSLESAWREAFSRLEPPRLAEILCSVEPVGDEAHLLAQLDYAAVLLAEYEAQQRAQEPARRRLHLAGTLCAAGFLMILLM